MNTLVSIALASFFTIVGIVGCFVVLRMNGRVLDKDLIEDIEKEKR